MRTPPVHRRSAALLGVFLLGACAQDAPNDVTIGLRNPTVTLAGTTRFDVGRFAGDWVTVDCIGSCDAAARYIVATEGVFVRRAGDEDTPYLIGGPGILRQMGGEDTLVVMWVDDGFRTAAIGDAEGRWAAILNRSADVSPDRINAAKEVLDFNGWDVSKLMRVKPLV
ncbi:MAG: hypothetical protein ABJL67_23455 [Sulfitobacter sp.]